MADKLNVHQRLAAAMSEVTYIQKEQKQGMKYTIVSHDVVTAKVRPVLLKHGIVYYPIDMIHSNNGNRAEVQLSVRFVNIDDASDCFDVCSLGYGIDSQDKGPGKAISYAVKYALLKAMGLETGDDADHDNIEHIDRDQEAKAHREAAQNTEAQRIIQNLKTCETLEELKGLFTAIEDASIRGRQDVIRAKDDRKSDLMRAQKEAA
mgnify:CR=1 FL=1